MRAVIIGLSIVFFLLSAVVLYKGLSPPSNFPLTAPGMVDPVPEVVEISPVLNNQQVVQKNTVDVVTESIKINKDRGSKQIADMTSAMDKMEEPETEKPLASTSSIHVIESPENKIVTPHEVLATFGGEIFRSGEDKVKDIASLKIEKLISEMALFPDASISVEGHSDNLPVGKLHKNNMNLSIMRARAIANLLIERGIARDRISVTGYGDTRPIDSNHTEEGRGKNRRVEVRLTKKD